MSFLILHTSYFLPESLPPPEIFCLPVVPQREAAHFFTVLTFFLSLFPLLKVFGLLIMDWFQAKGFSHTHAILMYLCSVRWIVDLNSSTCSVYPSFADSKCFLIFFTAVECLLGTFWKQLLGPPILSLVTAMDKTNSNFPCFMLISTGFHLPHEWLYEVLQVSQFFLILTPLNALPVTGTVPCLTTNTAFKVKI